MDRAEADDALRELVAALAEGRSLLAWTMTWCAHGEASWRAIWDAASDAKAMLNVLAATGSVRGSSVRSGAPYVVGIAARDAVVRLAIERADGSRIERGVRVEQLATVVREEIPTPPFAHVVEASRRPR